MLDKQDKLKIEIKALLFEILEFCDTQEYEQIKKRVFEITDILMLLFKTDKGTCPKCNGQLVKSKVKGYNYFCAKCDEDFFNFEVGL